MCRLVVCGPDRQIDLAVPASVLVVDLLPALLHHLGDGLADTGLMHGGWVLQRAGSPPLDEESTVAALGLYDGEVVYLRPRAEQLPEVDFDDLVDGIAAGVAHRRGRWRPEMVRWTAQGAAAVTVGLGVVAVAMPGPVPARTAAALAAAVIALGGGAAVARTAGERGFGALLGVAAVAFAAVAGLVVPGDPSGVTFDLTGAQLLAGSATAAAAAILAGALLGSAAQLFIAPATTCLLGVLGGTACLLGGLSAVQAAGVVAVLSTALVPAVPMLAFRMAGLRLAPLPTRPEHLQEELEPEPAVPLMSRAQVVDGFMTALYAGLGAAATMAALCLAGGPGWAESTLLVLLALVWSLSARPMTSAWHRLAQAVPAVAGFAGFAVGLMAGADPLPRLAGLLLPFVAVPLLISGARGMRERRLMPYWGRIGDLTLTIAAVALMPILLAVLDVYGYFRAIGG
jgi:type VII secretion integral membrane protein EccD